jgi:adenylate kinase
MNIFISGTPGTGKSEVADALGKKTSMKVIHVSEIVEKFSIGFDEERDTKEIDHEKLSEYLSRFDNVIIESHLPLRLNAKYIVLRCEISELSRRLKNRGWKKEKIEENLESEIFDICYDDLKSVKDEIIEINTTKMSAEEVAREIKRVLKI